MRKLRDNAGATLVELLITVAIGSLVTMAAVTVLIFGLKAHHLGLDTTARQNEIQMGISVIRELLAENTITGIGPKGEIQIADGTGEDGKVVQKNLLYYDAEADAVCGTAGGKLLEKVTGYSVAWNRKEDPNLLTVTLTLANGKKYSIPVYCRMVDIVPEESTESTTEATTEPATEATTEATTAATSEPPTATTTPLIGDPTAETTNPLIGDPTEESSNPLIDNVTGYSAQTGTNSYALRQEPSTDEILAEVLSDQKVEPSVRLFVGKLASQLGSTGRILTEDGQGEYFSQWYIGSYAQNPTWNESTPWCACFVSWALDACAPYLEGEPPRFANVDTFWVELVTADNWKKNRPEAGDLIFFDWVDDSQYNPQHVGVVLTEKDGWIYTIEGNSNGVVAMRKYPADDAGIMGYGILNWK